MALGTAQWFNAGKGYRFIALGDGTPDVFVHYSAMEADDDRSLKDSQRVGYDVTRGTMGPRAEHVRPI